MHIYSSSIFALLICLPLSLSIFLNMIFISSDSQVLVSNSLAALSGSTSQRIYCDSLNISVCPLTESSKKVTHRNVYAQAPLNAWKCHRALKPPRFSVLSQRVQSPRSARGLAGPAARERNSVCGAGR